MGGGGHLLPGDPLQPGGELLLDMRFCLNGAWHNTPAGVAHYLEHKMFDTQEGNALMDSTLPATLTRMGWCWNRAFIRFI